MQEARASSIIPRRTRALPAFEAPSLVASRRSRRGTREPGYPGDGSTVAQVACEHLMHEHIGGFDADADDLGQALHHRIRPGVRRVLDTFQSRPFRSPSSARE